MKVGMIALTAALMMLAMPAWAGPADPCGSHPSDGDSDTVCDLLDNCSAAAGVPSCDTDQDGYGNPCDGDFDNDLVVAVPDFTSYFIPAFVSGAGSGAGEDMDCDTVVAVPDFTGYFIPQFVGGAPGPSGLACAGTVTCP
jgi:hypothetical protein